MKLTKEQLNQLRATRQLRERSPTLPGLYSRSWKTYVLNILISGVGIGFFLLGGWPSASMLIGGMLLGILVRDHRWYNLLIRSWPLTREITNWDLVDELLKEIEESAA